MGEERIVFEKEYLKPEDCDASLEGRLRGCMQGKYKLTLDFTKLKGSVHGDFYCKLFNSCVDEIEKQGKAPTTLTENLTLVFASKKSFAYETIELIGVQDIFNCQFNDEKTIVFEQECVAYKDHEPHEEKLRECMRGKYRLVLDFSKIKWGMGDFFAAIAGTCFSELDDIAKEQPDKALDENYIKNNVTLIFESETCHAYDRMTMMGVEPFFNIQFKNKT